MTITLSDPAAERLRRAAELANRPIDDVVERVVDAAIQAGVDRSPEAATEIAAMQLLSDRELRRAAKSSQLQKVQRRFASLNDAAGRHPLTPAERDEQEALLADYRQAVLRRGAALAVLHQRRIAHEGDQCS